MDNFKTLFEATSGKVSAKTEVLIDLKRECANQIPVTTDTLGAGFNTTGIAQEVLNGAYLFEFKYETYLVTAEDAAKVIGLTEALNNSSKTKIKIGRKSFDVSEYRDYSKVSAKVYKLNIEGEQAENVIPSNIPSEDVNLIKNRVIAYAIKAKLTDEYVQGWFTDPFGNNDKEEKVGFYCKPFKDGVKLWLRSSHDFIKNKPCVIFGQQHTSKNERFTYFDAGELDFAEFTYRRLAPPRSYSKSFVKERSDGVFVAK